MLMHYRQCASVLTLCARVPPHLQHATVLELLDAQLQPGNRVLDVGSGRWQPENLKFD